MNSLASPILALALATALPAAAQTQAELLGELKALRERIVELEKKVQGMTAPAAAAPPAQWGMTPEQARELSRVTIKAEAMQDNFADQGFKGLKVSGQIDPTFIANRAQNSAGFVFLNNGDARYTYDNSYFGMAVLDFEKETEGGSRWKLTLAPERGAGALFNGRSVVHEASVSLPLGDLQTRLWLGQIPDWTGYEITLPAGNKLITHNLLFDTTAPTAYTGAVLDLKSGKWWTRIGLASMNSPRYATGHRNPALIYRIDYAKGEFVGWGLTGLHGRIANPAAEGTYRTDPADPATETPFADASRHSRADLLEVDGYFIRGDWTVLGQASWGQQKKAAIFNSDGVLRDAAWWGLSGTAGYKFTPRLEGIVRADYVRNRKNGGGLLGYSFDDPVNGIGRGIQADGSFSKGESVGADRYALSFGMNYLFDENTNLKLEVRYDAASQPVFYYERQGDFRRNNLLLGASVVVRF